MKNGFKLIDEKTGREVKTGEIITSGRGEAALLTGFDPPRHSGSTGRVYVEEEGADGEGAYRQGAEYFPGVYGLRIVAAHLLKPDTFSETAHIRAQEA